MRKTTEKSTTRYKWVTDTICGRLLNLWTKTNSR